jgi:uncharacterized coiled-coil protein SlyX
MNEQEQAEVIAELQRMLSIAREQADYVARLETQMEHLQARLREQDRILTTLGESMETV